MISRMTLEPMNMDEDYPGEPVDNYEVEAFDRRGWMGVFVDPEWDDVDEAEFRAMKSDLGKAFIGFDSDDYGN